MSPSTVKAAARETREFRPLRVLVRAGFAVNGVVHALIGVLALGLTIGIGGQADHAGAFAQIASSPGGVIAIWLVTIALAALGLWYVLSAFLIRRADSKRRIAHIVIEVGKGLAYLFFAATAFTFARGGSSNGEAEAESLSRTLLAAPGGVILLTLIGLLVVAVGVHFVVKGLRRKFVDDIEVPAGTRGRAVIGLGVFGYVAKGVALGFTGVLFVIAALQAKPEQAVGLDGGLRELSELPLGKLILALIGVGFVAYGAYCMLRARLARL